MKFLKEFQQETITLKLADGTVKVRDVLLVHVDVFIENRCVPTTFII